MKHFKTFENFMNETTDNSKERKRIERKNRLERIIGKEETCDMSDWKDYVPVKDEPVKEYDLQSGTTSISEEDLLYDELLNAFRDRYNQEPFIDTKKVIIKEPSNYTKKESNMSDWQDYEPDEISFFTKITNFLTMNSIKNWISEFFKSNPKVEKPVVEKKSFLHSIKMWFYK